MSTPITVRGAREHNLVGVDLDLPRESLVVFTGVSGSGKSSLAFDTLHAEGQRRYLEALADAVRGTAALRRPEVDVVTGLPPTIALDQRAAPASGRATVGTFSEALPVLRVIFARAGEQRCPVCDAPVSPQTHDEIVARIMALPTGTRLTLEAPVVRRGGLDAAALLSEVSRAGFSRVRVGGRVQRVEEVSALAPDTRLRVVVDRVKLSPDRRDRIHDAVRTASRAGAGVIVAVAGDDELVFTDHPYCLSCDRSLPALEPALLSFASPVGACPTCRGSGEVDGAVCPDCDGTRLRPEARAVRWQGASLPDLVALPVSELAERASGWPVTPVTSTALDELRRRIGVLVDVGLGHLELARSCGALSAGEYQRLRLARQVGARLSGVLYVLDEPTAGLSGGEVRGVVALLRELRALGNTVLVVEHHPDVVAAADRVVDFGPGPGREGGRIVFEGDVDGLRASDTSTGRWLSGRETLPERPTAVPSGWVDFRGIRHRNVQGVDVRLPTGVLAAVTGPGGSGKTALLEAVEDAVRAGLGGEASPLVASSAGMEGLQRLVVVDRGVVRRTPRSNPATYTGLWDIVRELLAATREAQVRGFGASSFSLNVKGGRCEVCKGTGVRRIDLHLLPDVFLPCEVCGGRRFHADLREVRWKGHSADELLDLSAAEAHAVLAGHPRLEAVLRALIDVGLGYLPLGQAGHTLSGGEAQRLKLARELARASRSGADGTLYVLDDPSVGLHPADVANLLHLLRRLVDEGATVWMATHHAPLASASDHVVALGPGAGPAGGRVLHEGPPPR